MSITELDSLPVQEIDAAVSILKVIDRSGKIAELDKIELETP